jgi:hypothetical protein
MSAIQRDRRAPSIGAFILIAVGVIWLLLQAHVISGANLVVLFRFWPVILIAIGLELLLGRRSWALSLVIGAGTIVLLLALMVVGPSLGWAGSVDIQTQQFAEPLDDATSAQLELNLSVGTVTINALKDSNELITADLRYIGDVSFDVSSSNGTKIIVLSNESDTRWGTDYVGLSLADAFGEPDLRWNIGLSPEIPLDLRLNGGVGTSMIDLSGVQLSSLSYHNGVGDSTVSLPGGSYDVDVQGGVGGLTLRFASEAPIDANLKGGVGETTLVFPANAPVRLEVDGGLGGVNVPSHFTQVRGGDDSNSGVWESDSYAGASDAARITVDYEGGVGRLNVQ